MAETYTLHVAGLTRELTICKVNDHMDIAAFIMLGDAELTVAAAAELLKKCPDFDILLTAEAKGIPLAHEMSRQSGKPYVCARKGEKLYMTDPVVVEDQSITTAGKQKLVIDRKELEKMNGKRVLVVDDVISTGGSLKALDALAEKTQCTIVGQAAVLIALRQQYAVLPQADRRRFRGGFQCQNLHRSSTPSMVIFRWFSVSPWRMSTRMQSSSKASATISLHSTAHTPPRAR